MVWAVAKCLLTQSFSRQVGYDFMMYCFITKDNYKKKFEFSLYFELLLSQVYLADVNQGAFSFVIATVLARTFLLRSSKYWHYEPVKALLSCY